MALMFSAMPDPNQKPRISGYDLFGYAVAAAILIPLGIWLKATDPLGLSHFFAQFVGY